MKLKKKNQIQLVLTIKTWDLGYEPKTNPKEGKT